MAPSPTWSSTNVFTTHAARAAGITRCSKGSCRAVKNRYFPMKLGACINRDMSRRNSCIGVLLIVEKTAKEFWKFSHLHLQRGSGQVPFQPWKQWVVAQYQQLIRLTTFLGKLDLCENVIVNDGTLNIFIGNRGPRFCVAVWLYISSGLSSTLALYFELERSWINYWGNTHHLPLLEHSPAVFHWAYPAQQN